jgi:4-cresol dehydrogenase (hydroxylating)
MNHLAAALEKWKNLLGQNHVVTDISGRKNAETATFATQQSIPAIIRPGNRSQVQECLRIANRYHIPLYPVSRGKNWGLGSRVPTQDNSVLMELDRMDRIVAYDERLSYITVEPGVTFCQASEFLQAQSSSLFLPVIGGPPESSLIGNALERGDGIGPYGERIAHACAMEVVLPTGECVHTGFDRFEGSKVAKISRWGVGPQLDGLFSQSNLGIVTQMTFWLMKRPKNFQTFLFTVRDMRNLEGLIEKLRDLQSMNIIRRNSLAIWNEYKMVASERQFPWEETGGKTPLSVKQLKQLKTPWGKSNWIGVGGLYSPTRRHAKADYCLIKEKIGNQVDRLIHLDQRKARLLRWCRRPLTWLTKTDIGDVIDNLYDRSVFLGFPTERSTRSTYWRKKRPLPKSMNPDRDRCGVLWLCPVIPYVSEELTKAIDMVNGITDTFHFEPNIAFIFPSERSIYMFPSIIYDRENHGEDERAMACHHALFRAMLEEGYFPYRLGIQSMDLMPQSEESYEKLILEVKNLLDPNGILSPGRYHVQKAPVERYPNLKVL